MTVAITRTTKKRSCWCDVLFRVGRLNINVSKRDCFVLLSLYIVHGFSGVRCFCSGGWIPSTPIRELSTLTAPFQSVPSLSKLPVRRSLCPVVSNDQLLLFFKFALWIHVHPSLFVLQSGVFESRRFRIPVVKRLKFAQKHNEIIADDQ